MVKQFLKFCIVGGTGYLLHVSLMAVMVEALDLHYLAASAISPVVVITYNFIGHKWWTFKHESSDVSPSLQRR